MTYRDWEDREMYAPPMFSMIETGESKKERIDKAMKLVKDLDEMTRCIRNTYRDFPISAAEHLGVKGCERWTFCATMYHEFGMSEMESNRIMGFLKMDLPNLWSYTDDLIKHEIRRWTSEHPPA